MSHTARIPLAMIRGNLREFHSPRAVIRVVLWLGFGLIHAAPLLAVARSIMDEGPAPMRIGALLILLAVMALAIAKAIDLPCLRLRTPGRTLLALTIATAIVHHEAVPSVMGDGVAPKLVTGAAALAAATRLRRLSPLLPRVLARLREASSLLYARFAARMHASRAVIDAVEDILAPRCMSRGAVLIVAARPPPCLS